MIYDQLPALRLARDPDEIANQGEAYDEVVKLYPTYSELRLDAFDIGWYAAKRYFQNRQITDQTASHPTVAETLNP